MSKQSGSIRKSFLIWVFANILGFSFLGVLFFVLPSFMSIQGIVSSTLILSIPISVAQWLALRRVSHTSIMWILTIPVGLLLAVLILRYIPEQLWQEIDDESVAVLTAGYLLIGFAIGLPQWLILRRQFSSSSIWLLGSTAGVSLGFGLVIATDMINQSGFISAIVIILVYAIATGLILTRLLSLHNRSQTDAAKST